MKRRTRRQLDKKAKIVKEDFFKLLKKAVSVDSLGQWDFGNCISSFR